MSPIEDPPHSREQRQPPASPHVYRLDAIAFIDGRNPENASLIHRHAARHTATRKREARVQAIQNSRRLQLSSFDEQLGTYSRVLLAFSSSKKSSSEVPLLVESISSSSEAQLSTSRAQSEQLIDEERSAPVIAPHLPQGSVFQPTDLEKSIIDSYLTTRCGNTSHKAYYERLTDRVTRDSACTYLLVAYVVAAYAAEEVMEIRGNKNATALFYRGRGQKIIIGRLSDVQDRASDNSIQAVLLLIAFVSKWRLDDEAKLHKDALSAMVAQRGGLVNFRDDDVLGYQLRCVETDTLQRLLGCGLECSLT